MDNPSEQDVMEFLNTSENTPKTVQLSKEAQEKFLESLRNSDIKTTDEQNNTSELKRVENVETCPHCDKEDTYVTNENDMTAVCTGCDKTIVLCGKCEPHLNGDFSQCEKCIYCDLANFYNYLRGKNTIEQFLGAMNPPLTDMTTVADDLKDKVLTYDDFLYDNYGDKVTWDVKYWEIYGLIKNSMLNAETPESDVIAFINEIIKRNQS